jgi:hypothetical protein
MKSSRGSILIPMLFFSAMTGITLAAYLSLVQQDALSVARSIAWHQALPVAEAGIEEGMAEINSQPVPDGTWISRCQSDGWRLVSSNLNIYQKQSAIGAGWYMVTLILETPTNVTLRSVGTVPFGCGVISRTVDFLTAAGTNGNNGALVYLGTKWLEE